MINSLYTIIKNLAKRYSHVYFFLILRLRNLKHKNDENKSFHISNYCNSIF